MRWRSRNRIFDNYPEKGPLRRELYPKHLEYFRAGSNHRERLMLAANRVGKTEGVGAYEVTCHLTGLYPDWWEGRRFSKPVKAWAASDTSKTVRDIIQVEAAGRTGRARYWHDSRRSHPQGDQESGRGRRGRYRLGAARLGRDVASWCSRATTSGGSRSRGRSRM